MAIVQNFNKNWKLTYTTQAKRDIRCIRHSVYFDKFVQLLKIIQENPFQTPPLYEGLIGNQKYSRRINQQHRLVYEVDFETKTITILSCWTHYHD